MVARLGDVVITVTFELDDSTTVTAPDTDCGVLVGGDRDLVVTLSMSQGYVSRYEVILDTGTGVNSTVIYNVSDPNSPEVPFPLRVPQGNQTFIAVIAYPKAENDDPVMATAKLVGVKADNQFIPYLPLSPAYTSIDAFYFLNGTAQTFALTDFILDTDFCSKSVSLGFSLSLG